MIIPKKTRKQVVNRLTLSGNTIQIQYKTHIRKKKKKHDNYEKHKTGVEHTQSAGKYNTDTKHKHKKIEKRKNMIIAKYTKTGGAQIHNIKHTHQKILEKKT